ncbi:LysR family transcriptional regulator, partial [bacterium]
MEIRHLRYFIAVAEEMNVTRAAARLFLTQPTLSRQIRDLEKALDVELFLRSANGWKLSPAGIHFLPQARELLDLANQTTLSMRQFADCRQHVVAIGYIAPAFSGFLGKALPVFREKHPDIEVRLFELSPGAQIEELRAARLDIALLGHGCEPLRREFEVVSICQIPLEAVVPKGHPLADLETIELEKLRSQPFIGFLEATFPGRNEIITQ